MTLGRILLGAIIVAVLLGVCMMLSRALGKGDREDEDDE